MRQFVIIGHDAPTTPEFSLDDLAGAAGRLDVLCRCVTSAFLLRHAIREDLPSPFTSSTVTFERKPTSSVPMSVHSGTVRRH